MDGALCVGVIGDRLAEFAPQETIEVALRHSAARLDCAVEVAWFTTPELEQGAATTLGACDSLWCAPGGPYRSVEGALEGIRVARIGGKPFLGTCAGFQHGVIECARNELGIADARHAEYEPDASGPLFIDELLCSLVGQEMRVRVIDETTRSIYDAGEVAERYYCRFGLE